MIFQKRVVRTNLDIGLRGFCSAIYKFTNNKQEDIIWPIDGYFLLKGVSYVSSLERILFNGHTLIMFMGKILPGYL
jgi:hypothetical protein